MQAQVNAQLPEIAVVVVELAERVVAADER
jgi:hypothetical protein